MEFKQKYDYKNAEAIGWLEKKEFNKSDGTGSFVIWSGLLKEFGIKIQCKLVNTKYGERMVVQRIPKLDEERNTPTTNSNFYGDAKTPEVKTDDFSYSGSEEAPF